MAEAKAKTMADEHITSDQDKVTIELFKDDGKYSDDVTVGINGRIWKIQRGVPVTVPRNVAMVLEQSMRQDRDTARMLDMRQREFEAETRRLGL